MVTQYAFIEELGLSTFDMSNPFTLGIVQKHVDKILEDTYKEVRAMVVENKEKIRNFADILKEKEEMTFDEIEEILYGADATIE